MASIFPAASSSKQPSTQAARRGQAAMLAVARQQQFPFVDQQRIGDGVPAAGVTSNTAFLDPSAMPLAPLAPGGEAVTTVRLARRKILARRPLASVKSS